MSNCALTRITEKRYYAISPVALTANATTQGLITVADTYCFKVSQIVLFKSAGVGQKRAKIQRVISETQFIVIDADECVITKNKLDMSAFVIGDTVELRESKRPVIDLNEISRQVYEEEPTVALRSHLVDWLGRSYCKDNPLPVDASVSVGDVHVQLTHLDNFPIAGDIHDSTRIGDGTDLLEINADGSINVKVNPVKTPKTVQIAVPAANTEQSYTFTTATRRFKFRVQDSAAKAQIGYSVGDSGANFWTVNRGNIYEEKELDLSSTVTIYFQLNKAGETVEILYWE